MNPYLPNTPGDIDLMLREIGVGSTDDLFRDIPEDIRLTRPLNLPPGRSQFEVFRELAAMGDRNRIDRISFLGCGSYDHIIPSTVPHLIGRAEFYTSYTPYQAEISQGILQAIFEFQTMMCELTGLDVSNASLYDGHTAAVEALSVALQSVRKADTLYLSATIHPHTREIIRAWFSDLDVRLVEIPEADGVTSLEALRGMLEPGAAGVLVQSPNRYGFLEELPPLAQAAHGAGALLLVSANPMSLGILKPPGEQGADVTVGDVQPFGIPASFGGPSAGYITAREELLRKLPGRIAGQTLDRDGRRAFVLTLQAREQHIKRARATSNICSNQALAAIAATVYLAAVGKEGIRDVSGQCLQKAHYLADRLQERLPVRLLRERPFFNEFALLLPVSAETVCDRMAELGYSAGVPLSRLLAGAGAPGGGLRDIEGPDRSPGNTGGPDSPGGPSAGEISRTLIVAVTEKRTRAELDGYTAALEEALR